MTWSFVTPAMVIYLVVIKSIGVVEDAATEMGVVSRDMSVGVGEKEVMATADTVVLRSPARTVKWRRSIVDMRQMWT